jgi:hypothetical protein
MQQKSFKGSRRDFLKRSAGGIVSATTLALLTSHSALADENETTGERGYGPLHAGSLFVSWRKNDRRNDRRTRRHGREGDDCDVERRIGSR